MAREKTIALTLLDEEAEAVIANLEKFGHVNRDVSDTANSVTEPGRYMDEEERMRIIDGYYNSMTEENADEVWNQIKSLR